MEKTKKSLFDNPLLSTKVKSANAKLFPEGVLGYFIGPTLALLANSILSNYFNRYMTDILGLTTWANDFFKWLPVISVVFVVLGNILVGRIMDRTKSKAGKARPLLLLSIPISIIALLMLFVFSPLATADSEKNAQVTTLVMIAIGYNLWFAVAYPFYYTPHAALVNLSTRNSKSRSLLATISNATMLAAIGLCTMILPFFLNILFVETGATTADGVAILDAQASYDHWKVFVIALMIITAVGALVEYFFTRERVTEEAMAMASDVKEQKATPISKQAKACFRDRFWWLIIIFYILYQFGGMIKNVSQLYFCSAMFCDENGVYSTSVGGTFGGTLSIIGAIPTAVGMLIAWPLSNKIGKGKAIMFGAVLSAIGGAIGFIDPTNFVLVCVSFAVKALGSTPAMYLSLALLADTLDHQEAKHGFRTDGFTMTVYGAIMAGMTGVTTGVLNIVLGNINYTVATVNSPAMQTAMPWLFIGGETICYAAIAILFVFMGVEKFSKFDHKAITLDQKAAAAAEGVEYVDPAVRLKQEEELADAESEKARIAELKARCEKRGLDFEKEEAEYQRKAAEKAAAAEAKKQAAEEKRAQKEKENADKLAAMPPEKREAYDAAQRKKAEKAAAKNAAALDEFNAIRRAFGKAELTASDLEESNGAPVAEAPAATEDAEPVATDTDIPSGDDESKAVE